MDSSLTPDEFAHLLFDDRSTYKQSYHRSCAICKEIKPTRSFGHDINLCYDDVMILFDGMRNQYKHPETSDESQDKDPISP